MSRAKRVFNNDFDSGINYLVVFTLFIAVVGSIFLAWTGVQAGLIYTIMFVGTVSLMTFLYWSNKDDDNLKPISNYILNPISGNLSFSAFWYLIGFTIPFVIQAFFKNILGAFSIVSFSIPLFGSQLSQTQSFATAAISESTSWKIFNIMFVAGSMETFVYNFGFVLLGALVGILLLNLINGGKDLPLMKKSTFVLFVAFAMSTIFFVLSHQLNETYALTQFLIAGLFLLIANSSIYVAGVFYMFWVGYHQSNNLIYLAQQLGVGEVAKGFISVFGFIYIIFLFLLVFNVINNWDSVKRNFRKWINA